MEINKERTYYYSGRHAVKILHIFNNKGIIEHLEDGFIGSKTKGYKRIKKGEISMVVLLNCYEEKRTWKKINKEERKAYNKKYRESNKGKAKLEKWKKENPGYQKKYHKKWKEKNPGYYKEYQREWILKNPKYNEQYDKDFIMKQQEKRRKKDSLLIN